MKTKVEHDISEMCYNVINTKLGSKRVICKVEYLDAAAYELNKEAYNMAFFISEMFNKNYEI